MASRFLIHDPSGACARHFPRFFIILLLFSGPLLATLIDEVQDVYSGAVPCTLPFYNSVQEGIQSLFATRRAGGEQDRPFAVRVLNEEEERKALQNKFSPNRILGRFGDLPEYYTNGRGGLPTTVMKKYDR